MKLNWLDCPMLAMERPGTFGAAGTSAGSPPSNLSDNVALSFTLIVLVSNDAVNVEASTVAVNWLTGSRARSATNHEAFHEPQSAAGILPADLPEKSTAGKMPAAPSRCEPRSPKEHRNPKDETADRTPARRSTFELRICFVICNSSFV